VALLTRIDPEGNAIQRDDRKGQAGTVRKGVSKNYQAKLTVDNVKIGIVGLHFLAKPNDEGRRLEREAQADAIRQVARELAAQGHRLVVLGDFNDYDGEPANRDHIDSAPISNVLRIVRELDPTDITDDLVNAASFVPKAQRYTSFWDRNDNGRVDPPDELTSIDHVLLSSELAAKVESVEMAHDQDPTRVSDHFPIVVRLKLCETGPIDPGTPRVRIANLLPNAPGDESENEEAAVRNSGTSAVSLLGWTLRDLAGQTWRLDALGSLQPGEEKTIRRNGQAMALGNRGDTIDLVDPAGIVVHTVTYGRVAEGEVVTPAN
jgi:exonuclease III